MRFQPEYPRPMDIERRSMELIEAELPHPLDPAHADIIKRVIHTTADFDFADALCFSPGAAQRGLAALTAGCRVVTDTSMACAGINKPTLSALGGEALCFISDETVAADARARGVTRSAAAVDRAAALEGPVIYAVGNAPTALLRLSELIAEGRVSPALIIGTPVGFVNVVESKELVMRSGLPYIVARGRKGGSAVAAAIVNALLYRTGKRAV